MTNKIKIAQITSRHSYLDARIKEKECMSLAAANYDVVLLAPNAPNLNENGVNITGFNQATGVFGRLTIGLWRLYRKTLKQRPSIVHFHDPDVILIGLLLKLHGMKVIFDVHEDFPGLAYDRKWVPKFAKWPLSIILKMMMKISGFMFDGIVAATPNIAECFPRNKTVIVRNMSRLELFNNTDKKVSDGPHKVCYVGGMSETRGFIQMLDAINLVNEELDCELCLGGTIPNQLLEKSDKNPGWKYTNKMGFLSRKEVAELYSSCVAGLVVLAPTKNHFESLPIKMFEYMASSLPVIASNFPLWIDLIRENKCGICVEPDNFEQIAEAIKSIIKNSEFRSEMGSNGKYFAETKYNWVIEEKTLLEFYENIIRK